MRKILPRIPLYARGDSGTIYIVFIMALIIVASFVMVNGLTPEFDDNLTTASPQAGGGNGQNGFGSLPDLPPKGSDEYQHQRDCAKEARKGLNNEQIAKKGKVTVRC